MKSVLYKHSVYATLLLIAAGLLTEISAESSAGDYDYSHRKRDCEITLVSSDGEPLAATLVGVALVKNDFTFGGSLHLEAFDSIGIEYGQRFLNYFDIATPKNEITWEHAMDCSEKCEPDFSQIDFYVNWLHEQNADIRGHNLFRNGNEELVPEWTRTLESAEFKQAMQERITSAMEHFKGKVTQWDLINEICRGEDGSLTSGGILATKSGDSDIFNWIPDQARVIDSSSEFIISDYDLITSGETTTANYYINMLKPLGSKFDLIGAEGHFGASMDKNTYEPAINYLAEQLEKPVVLTDVDFDIDTSLAPDKLEELMRTCFANKNVEGITMGSWCQPYMDRNGITSYFVDSLNNETPVGQRWRDVRSEWKSEAQGYTDESGKFSFNGFQGEYMILISCNTDTFHLEPGEGTQTVEVRYEVESAVHHPRTGLNTTEIIINGIATPIILPAHYNKPLFLTTYSLSGQQLFRSPLNPAGRRYQVPATSSCCRVFRIETANRLTLYTGKITAIR